MYRWLILVCAGMVHLCSLCAEAKEEESSVVSLPAGKTIQGDYFAYGDIVEISGTVLGDAYISASQVFIDGKVMGDVLVMAGSVDISGHVENNVRTVGGQIAFSGTVGHNMTVLGGNVNMMSDGEVKGNFVCVSGNADIASTIGGNGTIASSNLRFSGSLDQTFNAYSGHLRITSRSLIGGDLHYRSSSPAIISPSAIIRGSVVQQPSLFHNLISGRFIHSLLVGSKIAGLLMNFLFSLVVGWIILKLFPRRLHQATDALEAQPARCLAYGFIIMILFPLTSLILLISILGIPFALALIALNVVSFYTAKIFTIFWASNSIFSKIGLKKNRLLTFGIALIIYFALTAIPIFGFIVTLIALLFGLGAPLMKEKKSFLKRLRET